MCQAPEWLPWLLAAYPVIVHTRTLLPLEAQGWAGMLLKVLDVVAANYGSAANKK